MSLSQLPRQRYILLKPPLPPSSTSMASAASSMRLCYETSTIKLCYETTATGIWLWFNYRCHTHSVIILTVADEAKHEASGSISSLLPLTLTLTLIFSPSHSLLPPSVHPPSTTPPAAAMTLPMMTTCLRIIDLVPQVRYHTPPITTSTHSQ